MPWFIVTTNDTVLQATDYVVKADHENEAKERVAKGMYAVESETTTMDTIDSNIVSVMELDDQAKNELGVDE